MAKNLKLDIEKSILASFLKDFRPNKKLIICLKKSSTHQAKH